MPGITAANIKTENIGSLKTATVNIKCWDRAQFEIIDTLYLRLGFYVLLEWGHTVYTNNNKNNPTLIKDPLSLETEFFSKKNNIDDMLALVVKKRLEGFGNYDALFGKVVNFSWNFNNDGSYDIVITIRSVGDIIESLKVNVFSFDSDSTEDTDNKVSANIGGVASRDFRSETQAAIASEAVVASAMAEFISACAVTVSAPVADSKITPFSSAAENT